MHPTKNNLPESLRVEMAIETADACADKDTADLFTEISRQVDKDVWFLEAHLHDRS